MTYKPASYAEMVQDAVRCVEDAIKQGLTRLEVEFPPVPTKIDGACCPSATAALPGPCQQRRNSALRPSTQTIVRLSAGYKGASDMFIDSNVQLALAAARQVGQRISISLSR